VSFRGRKGGTFRALRAAARTGAGAAVDVLTIDMPLAAPSLRWWVSSGPPEPLERALDDRQVWPAVSSPASN
jgi:hypothetical protein